MCVASCTTSTLVACHGGGSSPFIPVAQTLAVSAACMSPADLCTGGSTATSGSVQFTALGDTATLTPNGTPTYTLKSDTCGNWVAFSPAAGSSATSFTAPAKSAGANGSPALAAGPLSPEMTTAPRGALQPVELQAPAAAQPVPRVPPMQRRSSTTPAR